MLEEAPKQLVIRDLRAKNIITYSPKRMTIERRINHILYGFMLILGLASITIILLTQPGRGLIFLIIPAAILVFAGISERSHRYEFDKEKAEIKCNWVGFLGTSIGKEEITCHLGTMSHIRIYQVPTRYRDYFKIKLVLQNGREIDLPSGYSLSKCMEYATIYKDFLEIRSPLWLPQ